jgi:hypothetical protein
MGERIKGKPVAGERAELARRVRLQVYRHFADTGRIPAERQALLDAAGLTGPFWSLTS